MTAQLRVLMKEDSRSASESGKKDGTSMIKIGESTVRGTQGSVFFIVIKFLKYLKHSLYVLIITHRYLVLLSLVLNKGFKKEFYICEKEAGIYHQYDLHLI